MLKIIKQWLARRSSKFKVGDVVEFKQGGNCMTVIEVITSKKIADPLINCKWYEPKTNVRRTNLFSESQLKMSAVNQLPVKAGPIARSGKNKSRKVIKKNKERY